MLVTAKEALPEYAPYFKDYVTVEVDCQIGPDYYSAGDEIYIYDCPDAKQVQKSSFDKMTEAIKKAQFDRLYNGVVYKQNVKPVAKSDNKINEITMVEKILKNK